MRLRMIIERCLFAFLKFPHGFVAEAMKSKTDLAVKVLRLVLICFLAFLSFGISSTVAHAAGPWNIASPDNNVVISISQVGDGSLTYSVAKSGTTVIESSQLGINTGLADFRTGLSFVNSSTEVINETYSVIGGRKASYTNHANQLTLRFTKNGQSMHLILRAYNDGVAYRYHMPTSTTVSTEYSQYNLPNGDAWIATEDSSYEQKFPHTTIANATATTTNYAFLPLLRANNNYVWIGEAAVYGDYSSSYLRGSGASNGVFNVVNATSTGTHNSPWRVAILGSLAQIIESNLVENLNPPLEVNDTSWIKPGRSAWSWFTWDDQSSLDVAKTYVDYAAQMGWEYYLCDAGWQSSWVPELVAYAGAKNVGIMLWGHSNDFTDQATTNSILATWASWGIKGIKIDFFLSEGQDANQKTQWIAEASANLKLLVNYHGVIKPTGESRRWPHVLTREAIRGIEHGADVLDDSVYLNTVPFTRGVAGPSDFTPAFLSWYPSISDAFQLATALTIHSGIINYSDRPGYYHDSKAREFLRHLPAEFDDTKMIEGDVGNYYTVARRSGENWFIGGTTNAARTATIPLSFLGNNGYYATIYRDNSANQHDIIYETQYVTNASTLSIPENAKGGFVVYISDTPHPAPGTAESALGPNLALNKPITASSHDGSNYEAFRANDGDIYSRWNSAPGQETNQWLEIDLGSPTKFNTVITREKSHTRVTSYKVQYHNGTGWADLSNGTYLGSYKRDTFSTVTAQRVRLFLPTSAVIPTINEVEIYYSLGTNLAEDKNASASSIERNELVATKAVDGDLSTRWNSAAGQINDQWLEVNFGVPTTFNTTVTREMNFQRVSSYKIQYHNGTSWVDIATGTTIGNKKVNSFSAVTANRVRLYIATANQVPSIEEFAVYNGGGGTGTQLFFDNFEAGNANQWSPQAGIWSVCNPTSGASKEYCTTGTGDHLSLAGNSSWTNYSVESAVMISSTPSNHGGICVLGRVQDANHFYQAEIKPTSTGAHIWTLYKNVGGQWNEIVSGSYNWSLNQYYGLRLTMNGSNLTVSITADNGNSYQTLGTGTDTTYTSGKIGVRTWGGTIGSFDIVTVKSV